MDNEKITDNSGKCKKKYKFSECTVGKHGDCLSMSIICHSRLYFQCWLIQNNLKLETNIVYTKVRKARGNNRKSEVQNIVKKKKKKLVVTLKLSVAIFFPIEKLT